MTETNGKQRDDHDQDFLIEVGQRVRRMRGLRGMSRRVLAETSGVSERYIAQLETGNGNLSITLLRHIAEAIGAPLEDLVAEAERQPTEWPLFRELLNRASPQALQQAKAVLSGKQFATPAGGHTIAVDRVALIGLRGAGKSTLGRRAAEALAWPFVELNKEIERESGFSMTEIFSLYGQEGYRRLEQASLHNIIERTGPMILATGGGIVADPVTLELLLTSFFTVWIKASPTEHMSRVRQQGDLRPMTNESAAMAELVTILSSREPLYARARATIDTSGRGIDACLQDLLGTVGSYCAAACPYVSCNRVP